MGCHKNAKDCASAPASAPYFLSVDGGGSSSTFLVTTWAGEEIARCTVGSTSLKSVGAEQTQNAIASAIATLKAKGIDIAGDAVAQGVWGLSGCDFVRDMADYRRILTSAGFDARHHICNDSALALAAGAPKLPAVVIISGTGSIAYGTDNAGHTARAGGLNYAFSDLGSGTWLGMALLREHARYLEHMAPFDSAFTCVERVLGLSNLSFEEKKEHLAELKEPAFFASLAYRVLTEDTSSPLLKSLIVQTADHLADLCFAVIRQLQLSGVIFDAEVPVVLAGGMFDIPSLREYLIALLKTRSAKEGAEVSVAPAVLDKDPVWGGIAIARAGLAHQ